VRFRLFQDASALLAATMSPNIHPSGFYISSNVVAVSFALPYAFQLLPTNSLKEDWCVSASPAIGGSTEGWTRYWDDLASIEEQTFEVPPREKRAPEPPKEKKGKEKQNGPPIGRSCPGNEAWPLLNLIF
jgi:RNA-binding protein 5/10